ncbi:MAG: serine/threonine-protein kinase [Candidatus Eremiobacteraeota bacterium]|nr:serine/threonine-protein kinase [Candidatus Eremiobacteraeota bacterium]
MERSFSPPRKRRPEQSMPFYILFPSLVTGTIGLLYLLLFLLAVVEALDEISQIVPSLMLLALSGMAALAAWGIVREKNWAGKMLLIFFAAFIAVFAVGFMDNGYGVFYSINFIEFVPFALMALAAATAVCLIGRWKAARLSRLRPKAAAESQAAAACPRKGEVLRGRYEIAGELGRGAMGSVYLVKDLTFPSQDVRWVLKEIELRGLTLEERAEAEELFRKECALLKSLNHLAIPKLIEHFSDSEGLALVMEYIEGKSLEHALKESGKPFEAERVVEIAGELAAILQYLHSQVPAPLIFRDLKPSNIMITGKGRLRLIDFGIARNFDPAKQKDTLVYGTPGFSPPEQYGLGQTDERSDLYALGATLYYLLTEEDPQQFNFKFPSLRSLQISVPAKLEALLMKCLSRDRDERPPSAASITAELERIKEGMAAFQAAQGRDLWVGLYFIAAVALNFISLPGSRGRGYEMLVFPLVAFLFIIVGAFVLIYRHWKRKRGPYAAPDLIARMGNAILSWGSSLEARLQGAPAHGKGR